MMRVNTCLAGVVAVVALMSAGCSTPCHVSVDAIADPGAPRHRTFFIVPAGSTVSPEDLHFKEYAGIVNDALEYSDYAAAEDVETADFAVLINYGISDPHTTTHVSSTPIYGKDGHVVGSDVSTNEQTTYMRFLEIESVDAAAYRESGQVKPYWKTTATSAGASGDLREILPYLAAASARYFAADTHGQVEVDIHPNDPLYLSLRRWQPSGTDYLFVPRR